MVAFPMVRLSRVRNRVMSAFAVLEPPEHRGTAIEHADRMVFLRERFNVGAFLFGPLWMIWRRLWLVLIIYLAGMALVFYGLRSAGFGSLASALVLGLVQLLVGLEATTLLRWTRVRRGWRDRGVVIADDLEMAERRFFDSRTALRAAGPAPAAAAAGEQSRTGAVGGASPDVTGLFPEPGGMR